MSALSRFPVLWYREEDVMMFRTRSQGRLDVRYTLRKALVHFWGGDGLVYSVKNQVYLLPDLSDPQPILLGTIPWRNAQRICHFRLIDRAWHESILQVHEAGNRRLLVCNGRSWWSISPGGQSERIPPFSRTRPMNRGICTSAEGWTYVADYLPNLRLQDPVRIFRSRDLRSFEIAWEFPPGDIRHIHALIPDSEEPNRIWILTGDHERQARILYSEDDFETVRVFRSDGQRTRAVDMIVQGGSLIWGMDSPEEKSYLLSAGKKDPDGVKVLREIPGPAYYMARNQAGAAYLGTTAEAGAGVTDFFAHILGSLPDGNWEEIHKRRKDLFPQHGIFYFPRGMLPGNYVIFSQRGLRPGEGQLTVARDRAWEHLATISR